jgi:hypothetical protein
MKTTARRSLVSLTAVVVTTMATLTAGTTAATAEPSAARPAKSKVQVAWVSSAVVTTPTAITGVVKDKGKNRRRVVLQQHFADGWTKVAKGRTDRNGAFSLALPTHWLHSSKTRVVVAGNRKNRPVRSKPQRVSVVPSWTPQGSADSWSYIDGKRRARFNPCKPIDYRINVAQAAPWATSAVSTAIDAISLATGLRFRFRGTTAAVPWAARGVPKQTRGTDLLVSFVPQSQTKTNITNAQGRGGPVRLVWGRDPKGRLARIVRSGVVIDTVRPLDAAQGTRVAIHEIGHAIGLGHTGDVTQQMNNTPEGYYSPLQLGAGDLTGLAKVGRQSGCVRPLRR